MSVNDLIVQGAKPFLFLDYISINKIDLKKLKSIIKGIS
jgi:phosphoribosylformylglycinamidine cyclo-ligase